jgi:4'-phosphopantetheinyl transferase
MIPHLLQPASALPEHAEALLAPAEVAIYAALKVPKRRSDWLLGRITAKQLVAAHLGKQNDAPTLQEIVVAAGNDGAPFVSLHGAQLPLSLSISHSHAVAFCALVDAPGAAVGVSATVGADIEFIETRDPAFLRDYFTADEQAAAWAWPEPEVATTLLWSAKEAMLKALREGLRVDTRHVRIGLPAVLGDAWSPFTIALHPELAAHFPGVYSGWARRDGGFILTLALRIC